MTDRRSNLNLKKKNVERKTEEKKDWSNLLPELLGLIMSCLTVKDKFRASAVCKAWYKASVSIQIKDRHPWLMIYSLNVKRPFELYDPLQDKTYIMKFPDEIAGMKKVYYSKDGWLLMRKDGFSGLSFFNPFTRKHITLPNCQIYNECVMFTCAPTSNSCLVFGLTNIGKSCNVIAINTFRLGETKWNTTRFMSHEPYFSYDSKIVFSGGLFYCLDGFGSLAVFDPAKLTWKVHYPKHDIPLLRTYLVENKGDIFLLHSLCEKPRLFKLNRDDSWFWEEKENIGEGLTIFASVCASECRSNLTSHMKNKLFLSDIYHPKIHNYCFNQGRYLSNHSYIPFWIWRTSSEKVWIEHPKQSLEFI